uniref:Uncharacterized protein n=1 Tax=Anguilla anguilla TaxID=7936 RepID=A0A0E9T988_ANGAN
MPTTGTGSLVFIDDVTADRTATELILILSAQVASKYPQIIGRHHILQEDNDRKTYR